MFSKYDLHEAMNLKPGEMPLRKPPTPAEMRVGLARAGYYSTVIRTVRNIAEREGWNGEDTMTAIAFYTTLQLEVSQQYLSDVFMKMENPLLVVKDPPTFFKKDSLSG